MGTALTEADAADIRAAAASGDDVAKALLSKLPTPSAPEEPAENTGESASAPKEEPKVETTPEAKPKEEVDQKRDSTGPDGREKMHPAARRIVEREMRKMREAFEAQKAEMDELKRFIQQSQARTPQPKDQPEEDPLTRLLAKPDEFLSEREKRLIEQLEKRWDDKLQKVPMFFKRQTERDQAIKRLEGLEGFEAGKDESGDDLIDLISEKTGLKPQYIEALARNEPMEFADLAEKHWKEARKLSDKTKSDKQAATTGTAGAGKTSATGGAVTLDSLNQKFRNARDQKERDQILNELEALTKIKK